MAAVGAIWDGGRVDGSNNDATTAEPRPISYKLRPLFSYLLAASSSPSDLTSNLISRLRAQGKIRLCGKMARHKQASVLATLQGYYWDSHQRTFYDSPTTRYPSQVRWTRPFRVQFRVEILPNPPGIQLQGMAAKAWFDTSAGGQGR